VNFALPLLLFVVVYVLVILPQSRRRKQAAALHRAVEPGSKVILTSGLYATVVEIDDDAIIVEPADGVHLRYAKAAVLRVIPDQVDTDYDDGDDQDDEHDHDAGGEHDHDAGALKGSGDTGDTGVADHGGDAVARPSNREPSNRAEPEDSEVHGGNDAAGGPVPKS
jgi:preprotein translocase subunit YajC